jgi:hypothetical protein
LSALDAAITPLVNAGIITQAQAQQYQIQAVQGTDAQAQALVAQLQAMAPSAQSLAGAPTQQSLEAFQQALATASALGVINSTQAGQIQSQANGATDSQVQSLTAQLITLINSTPSAGAAQTNAAALSATTGTAATTATTTSWWSGSTSLLGYTFANSSLAIGGGIAAIVGYFAFRKKR